MSYYNYCSVGHKKIRTRNTLRWLWHWHRHIKPIVDESLEKFRIVP